MVDKGIMALAQGQYRIAENFYVGARYQMLDVDSRIKREKPLFPDLNLPDFELKSRISGVGPRSPTTAATISSHRARERTSRS
ncbi:hypothetical protein ACFSHP_09395 [Novosphingobium panipatense]